MIPYLLKRSKRKTIAIHITADARVEVRAPLKASKDYIDHFVFTKEDWINKHLTEQKQNLQSKVTFQINYGDKVLLQGKYYTLIADEGSRSGFDGNFFYIPFGLSTVEIKCEVIQIYKIFTKNLLTNKVREYAMQMSVEPTAVKVNSAKTRWGSCSGKNSLNFSWRLCLADDDVIDYIVVHELAHIKEHNHSKRFWAVVAGVLPDYKERQDRLRQLQKRLASEDWD